MRCFPLIVFALFAAICYIGCGDDSSDDPDFGIYEIPEVWGEENCEGGISIKAAPVEGLTDDCGYLWTGLVMNNRLIKYSDGISIGPGQFHVSVVWMGIDYLEIPEGTYEVYAFLSSDSSSVGDIKLRKFASGPYYVEVFFDQSIPSNCVECLLGDSLFLIASYTFGEYTLDTGAYEVDYQGYTWEVLLNGDSIDNKWLINLDNNGLFFPLKVTDSDGDLRWIIRATNKYDPYNVIETEVVIRRPYTLGTTNNEYDTIIAYWSNEYGIPPQIVKGIIDQETDFDNYKFRYEMDFDYITFQPSMYNSNYYKLYHLADSARMGYPSGFDRYGIPVHQGDSVATLHYDPYYILRDWSLSPPVVVIDTIRDSLITAFELAQLNSRFSEPGDNFVSQVIICSSYGLMQPMHVTLIDFADFKSRNPQGLYDDVSIAIHWGVKYFSRIYNYYTDSGYDWETRWRTAIGKYNGGPGAGEDNGIFYYDPINEYVNSVMATLGTYQPLSQE